MQWLGLLIFMGIGALLVIALIYLAKSQKTPNRTSASSLDDLYHSKGLGNVLDANEKLNKLSTREHQRHAQRGQKHPQHHTHG